MNLQKVILTDANGNMVARAEVAENRGVFSGAVDLGPMAAAMRAVFDEFEGAVNGQQFSVLDEIEDRITALGIAVRFDGGHPSPVTDLQIYPNANAVSFKVARPSEPGRL